MLKVLLGTVSAVHQCQQLRCSWAKPFPHEACLKANLFAVCMHQKRSISGLHTAVVLCKVATALESASEGLAFTSIQCQSQRMMSTCCRMSGPCSSCVRPCHVYHTASGAAKSSVAGQLSAQHSTIVGMPNLQQQRHGTLQAPGSRRNKYSSIIVAAGDSQDADVKQCVTQARAHLLAALCW